MNRDRIMFYLLAFVGMVLLIWQGVLFKEAQDAKSWPTTNGEIIVSEMTVDRGGSGSSRRSSTQYGFRIQYEYKVAGEIFVSNRVFVGQITSNYDDGVRKLLAKYPISQAVTVYYNPENFMAAVLEPGKIGSVLFVVIGFVFLVMGLTPTLFGRSKYIRKLNPGHYPEG